MRKVILLLVASCLLAFSPLLISEVFADQPPDPGGEPGPGGNPVGGGNPIGGGLIILATLGIAYGVKRIYDYRSHEHAE